MSPISIALNLLLAGLLVTTLMFGWMLNRRLKALKDSHAGFADSVAHLDRAAQRAETGLADLRATTEEALDLLTGRIVKARELADNLEKLTAQGAAVLDRKAFMERDRDRVASVSPLRASAERIAAERLGAPAAPHPVAYPKAAFTMTTEEEALAAAETLVLRLSQSEALTNEPPPRRPLHLAPRPEARSETHFRPQPRQRPEPAPAPPPRPEPRVNPRSRAQIDDDLFEPPMRGRLRAFDGGLA